MYMSIGTLILASVAIVFMIGAIIYGEWKYAKMSREEYEVYDTQKYHGAPWSGN